MMILVTDSSKYAASMYLQFLSLVAYAPGCKLNSLNDTGWLLVAINAG